MSAPTRIPATFIGGSLDGKRTYLELQEFAAPDVGYTAPSGEMTRGEFTARPASTCAHDTQIAQKADSAPKRRRGRPLGSRTRKGKAISAKRRHAWHMFRHAFAAQLRRLCDEVDVSAAELASAIGCCRGAVLGWMRGRCAPSLRTLCDVAVALDCSLVDLMPESAHHR